MKCLKIIFVDFIRAQNIWRKLSLCFEPQSLIYSKFWCILSIITMKFLRLFWRVSCSILSFRSEIPTLVVGLILFKINHNITNPSYFWYPLVPVHSKCCFYSRITFAIISRQTHKKNNGWLEAVAAGSIYEIAGRLGNHSHCLVPNTGKIASLRSLVSMKSCKCRCLKGCVQYPLGHQYFLWLRTNRIL